MKHTITTTQCSRPDAKSTLQKRRYKKFVTLKKILPRLLDQQDSPLHKQYRLTCGCSNQIRQEGDGKLKSWFCKNRWCVNCNNTRTAILIKKFDPIVSDFAEPRFVTLTIKNCVRDGLPVLLDEMQSAWKRIVRRLQYRLEKQGKTFDAIRKLEVTYNFEESTYHPHYHIMMDGADAAELLREMWIAEFGDYRRVDPEYQDILVPYNNMMGELFKYTTKMWKKDKKTGEFKLYPGEAMDWIFQCLQGKRTIQGYGRCYNIGEDEVTDEEFATESTVVAWKREEDQVLWEWESDISDWVDKDTGELLIEESDDRIHPLDKLEQVNENPNETNTRDAEKTTRDTLTKEEAQIISYPEGYDWLQNPPDESLSDAERKKLSTIYAGLRNATANRPARSGNNGRDRATRVDPVHEAHARRDVGR